MPSLTLLVVPVMHAYSKTNISQHFDSVAPKRGMLSRRIKETAYLLFVFSKRRIIGNSESKKFYYAYILPLRTITSSDGYKIEFESRCVRCPLTFLRPLPFSFTRIYTDTTRQANVQPSNSGLHLVTFFKIRNQRLRVQHHPKRLPPSVVAPHSKPVSVSIYTFNFPIQYWAVREL